ncbi:MAG: hypothetical protein M1818_000987 [Claussenomyces sp. TS43310]|nr:MAG: hypothetical protein M1818_000987 [Claussenomyces sp. TS43310]
MQKHTGTKTHVFSLDFRGTHPSLQRARIPHREFEKISINTAKCDVCDLHTPTGSSLQRCKTCAKQWCKRCMYGSVGDSVHLVQDTDENWTPEHNLGRGTQRGGRGRILRDIHHEPVSASHVESGQLEAALVLLDLSRAPRLNSASQIKDSDVSDEKSYTTFPNDLTLPISTSFQANTTGQTGNIIGAADAPWLQLTDLETAALRQRFKKTPAWNPSDTARIRELNALGRGVVAMRAAGMEYHNGTIRRFAKGNANIDIDAGMTAVSANEAGRSTQHSDACMNMNYNWRWSPRQQVRKARWKQSTFKFMRGLPNPPPDLGMARFSSSPTKAIQQ